MIRAAGLVLLLAVPGIAAAQPAPILLHGSLAGQQTLDEGDGGGSPFASALIEALSDPMLTLDRLPARMRLLTGDKSHGFQQVDAPEITGGANLRLAGKGGRTALVFVIARYTGKGTAPLPGAARDAKRVARALRRAGYDVTLALDRRDAAMRRALADFAERSAAADMALIYATGHGFQTGGAVRLATADYVWASGAAGLDGHSLPLPEVAAAARARTINLVLWAGCRTVP